MEKELILHLGAEGGGSDIYRLPSKDGGWQYQVEGTTMALEDDGDWASWSRKPVHSIQEALQSIMENDQWIYLYPEKVHAEHAAPLWKLVLDTAHMQDQESFDSWNDCQGNNWKRACLLNNKKFLLLDSDGNHYESTAPGELGGYRPKRIYGRLDCPSVLRAIAKGGYVEHRVFFADEQAAIAAGYRPCGKCMKEQYAKWKKGGIPQAPDYPWHSCPRQGLITGKVEKQETIERSKVISLSKNPETINFTSNPKKSIFLKDGEKQMSRYRLANGREVTLSRFALASTYMGVMEGSPETASKYIMGQIAEEASRLLPPAKPLVVVPPSEMPLPKWMCVAALGSKGAQQNDPDYRSHLSVCWFTDNTDRSIDAMLEEILPHLDWERNAQDYDIMDF